MLDEQPATVFVIDEVGTITAASRRAADLVERPLDEVVGSSVLEYVDPDATWAYAAAMSFAMSDDYADTLGGPVRIDVHTATGRRVPVELWTTNRLDAATGPTGVVCLLTPANAALGIAEAVAALADRAPATEVADAACRALAGFPVIADAAVVVPSVVDGTGTGWRMLAGVGVPSPLVDGTVGDGSLRHVVATGERVLFEGIDAVPDLAREVLEGAGHQALWLEPVGLAEGSADGVLVVARRHRGEPTPNELSYVHQAAAVVALAVAGAPPP